MNNEQAKADKTSKLSASKTRAVAHKIAEEICDIFEPGDDGPEVFERVVRLVLAAVRSEPAAPLPPLASPIYGLLTRRFHVEAVRASEIAKAIWRLVERAQSGDPLWKDGVVQIEELH